VSDLFKRYTRERYERNRKVNSIQHVPPAATVFHYSGQERNEDTQGLASLTTSIIRSVFSYKTYHQGNPYLFRKAVPSPRSIHPFFPVYSDKGRCYLYDSGKDEFAYLGYCPSKSQTTELTICADTWRVCSIYGEFGFALCLLEAGHIMAALNLAFHIHGRQAGDADFTFEKYNEAFTETRIKNGDDCHIFFSIPLKEGEATGIGEKLLNPVTVKKKYNYADELSWLGLDSLLKEAKDKSVRFPHKSYPVIADLKSKWEKRTSMNSKFGLYSSGQAYPKESFEQFLHFFQELTVTLSDHKLKFYLGIQNVEGYREGGYQYKEGQLTLLDDKIQLYSFFQEGGDFMNIDQIPFLAVVSIESQEDDLERFIEAHIQAGEFMHVLSVCFANDRAFSRPFKSLNDNYLQELFKTGVQEYFLYGCLFGQSNLPVEYTLR
jgi:hypothetical protein